MTVPSREDHDQIKRARPQRALKAPQLTVPAVSGRLKKDDRLAQTTPATAAAWVAQLPSGENRRNAIVAVAKTWLQQDRTAALRWLATSDLPAEEQARLTNQERGAP